MSKQPHYSYYRLVKYAQCPFRYHEELIRKTDVEISEPTLAGRILHDMHQAYANACLKAKQTQLFDQWEQIAHRILRKYSIKGELETSIMESFKDYVSSNEVNIEDLAGIEEQISLSKDLKPISWDKGWFRGKIDKLYIRDNLCLIDDYKTGYTMDIDLLQLEIYAWMISKVYPQIDTFQVQFDFTRFHFKKQKEISREEIPAIEKKILNRIQQIEEDKVFKPTIGSQCETCRIWHKCPAIKDNKSFQKIIPRTKKDAEKLLGLILSRQKELKELKIYLEHYVEREGNVVFNDMVATNNPTSRTKYDTAKILAWANKHGYSVIDALNVDSRRIKKVLPEGVEIPKSFYSISIDTEVEIKRLKAFEKKNGKEATHGPRKQSQSPR